MCLLSKTVKWYISTVVPEFKGVIILQLIYHLLNIIPRSCKDSLIEIRRIITSLEVKILSSLGESIFLFCYVGNRDTCVEKNFRKSTNFTGKSVKLSRKSWYWCIRYVLGSFLRKLYHAKIAFTVKLLTKFFWTCNKHQIWNNFEKTYSSNFDCS